MDPEFFSNVVKGNETRSCQYKVSTKIQAGKYNVTNRELYISTALFMSSESIFIKTDTRFVKPKLVCFHI